MTTKRTILRKATKRDLGFKERIARDIHGMGAIFIAAHTELDKRHRKLARTAQAGSGSRPSSRWSFPRITQAPALVHILLCHS
ncbi:MAG TPA: hypothetical protein EYQ18_18035 [Candidatus Handelsmanbacteria bacterium]|nr:hypothetical protein [Candidatus Handelsmanbacteria bacterium]